MTTSLSAGGSVTPTSSKSDGILDTAVFMFGTITNLPYSASNDIVIRIIGLVVDNTANANGNALTTSAIFSYGNGTNTITLPTTYATVNVVLPVLSISKVARPASSYVEAGGIIQYTVTITNTGTSPAYVIVISDPVTSAYLTLVANSVTSSVGAGSVTTGNGGTDTSIVVKPSNSLTTGSSITITYNATLTSAVRASTLVPNTAKVVYQSAPNSTDNVNNIRVASTTASASVRIAAPAINLVLNSTSIDLTPGNQVAIGETITFVASFTVPKGITTQSIVTVSLPYTPGKLSLINGQITTLPSGLSTSTSQGASGVTSDTNNDGLKDTVTFTFGDITSSISGSPQSSGNVVLLQVLALVVDVSVNFNKVNLTTGAVFAYNNGTAQNISPSPVTVMIVEPSLGITQTNSPSSGLQAGDVVQYTLTLANLPASLSPAFNVTIINTLSNLHTLVAGSVTASSGTTIVTGNGPTDNTIVIVPSTFTPNGAAVIITYNATLTTAVLASSTVPNVVSATYYSSPTNAYNSGNIRNFTADSSSSVTILDPSFAFSLLNTSISQTSGSNVAIGESVTFRASLSLPFGTVNNAVLTVSLPSPAGRLTYVASSSSASNPALSQAGTTVSFTFGTVVSTPVVGSSRNQIDVVLTVLMANTAQNSNGTSIATTAIVGYSNGVTSLNTASGQVSVTVVEPILVISKAAQSSSSYTEAGTIVMYTLTISHASGSAAPAFDTQVVDTLSPLLSLITSSIVTSSGAVAAGTNATSLQITPGNTFLPGSPSIVITYNATIGNAYAGTSIY